MFQRLQLSYIVIRKQLKTADDHPRVLETGNFMSMTEVRISPVTW